MRELLAKLEGATDDARVALVTHGLPSILDSLSPGKRGELPEKAQAALAEDFVARGPGVQLQSALANLSGLKDEVRLLPAISIFFLIETQKIVVIMEISLSIREPLRGAQHIYVLWRCFVSPSRFFSMCVAVSLQRAASVLIIASAGNIAHVRLAWRALQRSWSAIMFRWLCWRWRRCLP